MTKFIRNFKNKNVYL